jgi:hypothetical protein
MRRQRLTWQQRGGADRRASAHPAYPDEGPASPAYQPDPEADAYENGDTSSWAEDPHPGPYPNSAHPAYPDEGPASPAYKAAALEVALEKKAARCLRLASALMGPRTRQSEIEDQALSFMDLPDRAINASLARLAAEEVEEEDVEEEVEEEVEEAKSKKARTIKALLSLIAEDEEDEEAEEDEEDEEAEGKKKASTSRLASLRRAFGKKAEEATEKIEEAEDAADAAEKAEAKSKNAALRRLARALRAAKEKVEDAGEAEEKIEDEGGADKKASRRLAHLRQGFRAVQNAFRRLAAEDEDEDEDAAEVEEAKSKKAYGYAMTRSTGGMDAETMYGKMMAEEGMLHGEGMGHGYAMTRSTGGMDAEAEAMLEDMLGGAEGDDPEAEAMLMEMMSEPDAAPAEAMYEGVEMDPLGVLTDDLGSDDGMTDDDYAMAGLFGMKSAAEDKNEATEDEGKKTEASKKESRLRPQPKTASTGATRLGGGMIGRAATSEVSELSSLWESAPDVSKFF